MILTNFLSCFILFNTFPPYFTLPSCWCLTIYTRNSLSVFKDPTTGCSVQLHGISRRSRKIGVSPLLKKMIQSWGWVLILLTTIRVVTSSLCSPWVSGIMKSRRCSYIKLFSQNCLKVEDVFFFFVFFSQFFSLFFLPQRFFAW